MTVAVSQVLRPFCRFSPGLPNDVSPRNSNKSINSHPTFSFLIHHIYPTPHRCTCIPGALSRCNTSNSSLFSTRSTNSANKRKKKNGGRRRRVSISNDVHVVPIPQRSEYAPIVRQRLWTSGQELYQNAARNSVEFASEGWNWRSVTEDADMLRHTITKELIHPVHLHNAMQLAQQQAAAANSGNGSGGSGDNNAQRLIAHLPLERNDGPPASESSTNTTVAASAAAASAATVTHHVAAISRVEQHARRAAYQAPTSPTTAARC
eukprot:CAMPEP_0178699240 /NCGR_PEP_ID=MMETSP0699-20121125/10964_1 /TAXON_ID=265572 /ORGANISM="Extubocellulus spinifer, Strain CCMP396" /LENGTH=263 /DNA_ID=CAMNT_0020345353 /DNA_START=106 /DNA_END=897 /DNA_ORIENTATION=-